ncbi:MAG: serine hydrolase, partial [Woeseia sp.]
DYPFCAELLLPSFSTAKSIVAGLALMRLEAIEPGTAQTRVATLLPDCAKAGWQDITIENALDLATGRYLDTALEADESLPAHVAFLYAMTHREKIGFACGYFPRKADPGKVWAYHSSDTYVAGAAMRALLERDEHARVDIYHQLLVEPLWNSLALSAAIRSTRTTYDDDAQPLFGWGLSYQSDDIARIGAWLQAGASLPGGVSIDPAMLEAAMQRNPDDRGLQAGSATTRYNNGFWGLNIAEFIGCENPVWVPFMSGHGGISVVLFPNNTVYYHFADGYVYRWREAAVESNKIRNMCL